MSPDTFVTYVSGRSLQQFAFPFLPAIFASNPSVIQDVQWQAQRTIT